MEANGIKELRIGNLIKYGSHYFTICEIHVKTILIKYDDNSCIFQVNIANIKKIKLTGNWLIKFGVIKNDKCQYRLTDDIILTDLFEPLEYYSLYSIGKPLKYIHQLQNLYFALTGEELQINKPC